MKDDKEEDELLELIKIRKANDTELNVSIGIIILIFIILVILFNSILFI